MDDIESISEEEQREGRELTILLEDAANERPGAAEAFFERLLQSHVYVLIDPASGKREEFLKIDYEGNNCVPIFSEAHFVEEWAEGERKFKKRKFTSLIWALEANNWLYINAAQDVGKEISEWEVEKLREGKESIPELVSALGEDPLGELEVRSNREVYPDFKRKILPIIELYPELEEVFVVAIREGVESGEKPLIGLKWASGKKAPNEGKRAYIRSELQNAADELLPDSSAVVVDDLDDSKSPNHVLFSDATPFYFRKRMEGPGFFARLGLLLGFGRVKGGSSDGKTVDEEIEAVEAELQAQRKKAEQDIVANEEANFDEEGLRESIQLAPEVSSLEENSQADIVEETAETDERERS